MAKINFTAPKVAAFKCPPDKKQAFMWDSAVPGLGLRATPNGKPAFVFQAEMQGKALRITIGSPDAWNLPQAREKARELQRLIDEGRDPREQKREALAATKAEAAAAITPGQLWPQYLQEGKPRHKDAWKPGYRADVEAFASPGGLPKKRGKGLTRPGVLWPLMNLPLGGINEDELLDWHNQEARRSKEQAKRGLMIFRGFLRWCATRKELRHIADRGAGQSPAIAEQLPKKKDRTDSLEPEQIRGWWEGCLQLPNPVAGTYLRALVLTGARREEMAALRWEDVDFRWQKITLADKVTDSRTIPLTPYLAEMLASLPRRGEYVFASASKEGRITDPRKAQALALDHAGVKHVTIHGLRRTYIKQGRAVAPAGVAAQMSGHAPSAVAEGYAIRSISELRPYAETVERHILALAGVDWQPQEQPQRLRVVAG
ncbi:MAG: site-specific integrase [Comamonas sp.]|nr:site-specific integrase [Comamonas sp.]